VLDVADHALRLDAADPGDAHPRHQEGILAEGLERAAAERRPHQVHGRGEHDVVALRSRLVADDRPMTARQRAVEGGGQGDRRGHRRGLPGADPRRAVAVVGGRQPHPLDAVAGARVRAGAAGDPGPLVAAQQRDLLVA
jgi:hypothetical protein